MIKALARLASAAMLCASVSVADAQTVGDAGEGLALAQQACAACHATVPEQARSPNARAPRFADLAAAPGMTNAALMVALTTPHAGMPMFTLTRDQRDDVIAYILSLRQP
jgi:mono/diheme cytochrome c family protein